MFKRVMVAALVVGAASASAQTKQASGPSDPPAAALAAITEANLKRDMFALGGDNMRVSDASRIAINDTVLTLWKDVIVLAPMTAVMDQPIVWVGSATRADLVGMDINGKVVAAELIMAPQRPDVVPGFKLERP